jgi:hypothetical protein
LKSPWDAAKLAVDSFKSTTATKMGEVVSNIKSNVTTATAELGKIQSLYADINSTTVRAPSTSGGGNDTGGTYKPSNNTGETSEGVKALQEVLNTVFNAGLSVDGMFGDKTKAALMDAQFEMSDVVKGYVPVLKRYDAKTQSALSSYIDYKIQNMRNMSGSSMIGQGVQALQNAKKKIPAPFWLPPSQRAKGTLGTKEDGWNITDESWIGEEITLAAGKHGQLQYLKKGSAVMPADISANLVEWGRLNPDMLNIANPASGINMISNAINKPELKLDIENFLRCDNVSQDSMPELKKFVNEQMNSLIKQLNYSLKKSGAR